MLAALRADWIAYALLAAFLFGSGWKLRDYQAKAAELARVEAEREAMDAALDDFELELQDAHERSAALEVELARLRAAKQKTQIIREREIAKPAYIACPLPDGGLRLLNDAVAAGGPAAR